MRLGGDAPNFVILEIIRFYGIETIKNEIRLDSKSPFERKIRENFEKYIY